jgi:hypothetical protein
MDEITFDDSALSCRTSQLTSLHGHDQRFADNSPGRVIDVLHLVVDIGADIVELPSHGRQDIRFEEHLTDTSTENRPHNNT